MSPLNMNIKALNCFAAHPHAYILQASSSKKGDELNVMKKGIWTWIKIHIGSFLHLFDKKTVQFNEIAKVILRHKQELTAPQLTPFCDAFDHRVIVRNFGYFRESERIETIRVHEGELVLKFKAPSPYHTWMNAKKDDIEKEIADLLEKKWDIKTGYCTVNDRSTSKTILITNKGVAPRFQGFPKLEVISKVFRESSNAEKQQVQQELNKALAFRHVGINFLAPDAQGESEVRFSYIDKAYLS